MQTGIDQLPEYIESLSALQYQCKGRLDVNTVVSMLAIVRCIDSSLTAFLIKLKIEGGNLP